MHTVSLLMGRLFLDTYFTHPQPLPLFIRKLILWLANWLQCHRNRVYCKPVLNLPIKARHLNNAPFKKQENSVLLTLDQVFFFWSFYCLNVEIRELCAWLHPWTQMGASIQCGCLAWKWQLCWLSTSNDVQRRFVLGLRLGLRLYKHGRGSGCTVSKPNMLRCSHWQFWHADVWQV